MSLSSVHKNNNDESLIPERERIKKMILEMEENDTKRLSDHASGKGYTKPLNLFDLSLNSAGIKKKPKPGASYKDREKEIEEKADKTKATLSAGDVRMGSEGKDNISFKQAPPSIANSPADVPSRAVADEGYTVESIISEVLPTLTGAAGAALAKSPEMILNEILDGFDMELNPCLFQSALAEVEISENIETRQPPEAADANCELIVTPNDNDAGDIAAANMIEEPVTDLPLQPQSEIEVKTGKWRQILDNGGYMDDAQTAHEFFRAQDLIKCGEIDQALGILDRICLTSCNTHFTTIAYFEIKRRNIETKSLLEGMIAKERRFIALLEI